MRAACAVRGFERGGDVGAGAKAGIDEALLAKPLERFGVGRGSAAIGPAPARPTRAPAMPGPRRCRRRIRAGCASGRDPRFAAPTCRRCPARGRRQAPRCRRVRDATVRSAKARSARRSRPPPLTANPQSSIHGPVTPGWHPAVNKGRRAGRPLLLACDGAGELEFGPTERKAVAARMYHPELIRHPDSCPALVLNADYTPLSYYPLSLWPWQTAVKAMFLERVDVVAHYDREVHSPSIALKLPSVIALRDYVRPNEYPAFTRFNLFLRDRFRCVYCGSHRELTFDHVVPARPGRAHDVGECRHRLRAVQPQEGRAYSYRSAHAFPPRADPADEVAAAGAWPGVPAQLSPRQLARLSLLGRRARAVTERCSSAKSGAFRGPLTIFL